MGKKSSFAITSHRGFHLRFANGWGVSVQFGPCNYCAPHYDSYELGAPRVAEFWEAETAEVAVLHPSGALYDMPGWGDTVRGYQTSDQVAALIAKVCEFEPVVGEKVA